MRGRNASYPSTVTICTWLKALSLCQAPSENSLMASGSAFQWTLWRGSIMSLSHGSEWSEDGFSVLQPAAWSWGSLPSPAHSVLLCEDKAMSIKQASIRTDMCYSWRSPRAEFHSHGSQHDDHIQPRAQDHHNSNNRDSLTSMMEKSQRSEAWMLLGSSVGRCPGFISVTVIKYPDRKHIKEEKSLL